jgi:hypothetical protein
VIQKTIIAFSTDGEGAYCFSGDLTLSCSDIFGNADGDWVDSIADQQGGDGNICEDPLFCDAEGGDLTLRADSPCLPGNHPDGYDCGGMIGAWPEGCPATGAADEVVAPENLMLAPGVPNPFCGSTRIAYAVPSRADGAAVQLSIYDLTGRLIRRLVDAALPAGSHTVTWNGCCKRGVPVATGVYLCEIRLLDERSTRQIVLIR